MDPFVFELFEKIFEKAEREGALDDEARELMEKIRKKANDTPRHRKSSSNTDEFLNNTLARLLADGKKIKNMDEAIAKYVEIKESSGQLKSLVG